METVINTKAEYPKIINSSILSFRLLSSSLEKEALKRNIPCITHGHFFAMSPFNVLVSADFFCWDVWIYIVIWRFKKKPSTELVITANKDKYE